MLRDRSGGREARAEGLRTEVRQLGSLVRLLSLSTDFLPAVRSRTFADQRNFWGGLSVARSDARSEDADHACHRGRRPLGNRHDAPSSKKACSQRVSMNRVSERIEINRLDEVHIEAREP